MNKYSSYKPAGVQWLGEIPSHWKIRRSKYMWQETDRRSEFGSEQLLSVSQYDGVKEAQSDSRSESLKGYKIVKQEDLVINIMLAWLGGLGVSKYEGIVSPAYCVYKLQDVQNSHYLHYLYRTPLYLAEFARHSTGIVPSRWRMYTDDFGEVLTILPSIKEQNRIVEYLDEVTSKIDAAIAQQQKMIDLLNERKQIIINNAVIRGLDPNVKMKDSGVDWIGMIPEHWEVVPMRRFLDVRDGTHDTPSYLPRSKNTYPLITSKDFIEGEISFEDVKWISFNDFVEIDKRSHVDKYDVLTSMIGGNIGKSVIVKKDIKIAIKNVALFKTNGDYNLAKFIYYYMIGGLIKTQVEINSRGGAQAFLGLNDMRNLVYFDIPIRERNQIVDYLDFRLGAIDKIIGNCNRQITLLQERKRIIINDVVTGKVKAS